MAISHVVTHLLWMVRRTLCQAGWSLDLRGSSGSESKVGRMNKGSGVGAGSLEIAFSLLLGAVNGRRHWLSARYCFTVYHMG